MFDNSTLVNPPQSEFFFEDTVTYMCNDMYHYDYDEYGDVISEYTSTCNATGHWSVESELCQRKSLGCSGTRILISVL